MSDTRLHLVAVDKVYPGGRKGHDVHAVRALDLVIDAGETVALLGSSGCGKTSTLRMIAGFEAVTRGRILLNGREIHALAPAQRNVAMAFEGYALYPPLTVRENIAFALKSRIRDPSEVTRRVTNIAGLLEIESLLDRYPTSLSGGQQQRASLARALVRDADLHLFDEPMGQLEPRLRAILRGRIRHYLAERGLTAILVTHDQTEANALGDRIAVMEDGELQQFATSAQLRDAPANLFVGSFIGEPPMNVLNARVVADGDHLRYELAGGVALHYKASEVDARVREAALRAGELTLGVRPHAVHVGDGGLVAQVVSNQWLGDQSHLALEFAGQSLVAVEHDAVAATSGATTHVTIAASDLHLFDRSSGGAISHGNALA